ncbi:NACHT domain-containing protein [Karstenula rhodostoma CBS 690.94]|uniref:NACHT domain-containing protein n=1 Tax=Karstenula rhodostoma CBS 690.94 TaxID=1392251 RepID=A0A9P4PWA1_9PLEO|nr:NACHT domain-containing protein [Karstenula rhodostoma CBS 690.94]
MLGFRHNPFGKRKRWFNHTNTTPTDTEDANLPTFATTIAKDAVVAPVPRSTIPKSTQPLATEAMQSPTMTSSFASTNGFATPPDSSKTFTYKKSGLNGYAGSRSTSANYGAINQVVYQGNHGHRVSIFQETAVALKKKSISQLGAGVYQSVAGTTFFHLLEWIRTERLTTLPHKGSRWDRVLIRALFFAEQLHNLNAAIQGFALDSHAAASLGYDHARLLLELGLENSGALDRAFAIFYKLSLSFSTIHQRMELLAPTASTEVHEQLSLMYTDLLSLVVDVAVTFYKAVKGMSISSVSIDIFETFGDTIDSFHSRRKNIVESLWNSQIEGQGLDADEAIDIRTINRWLAPQDRVLATLSRDHTIVAETQAEFTCLWFQKPLTRFINGNEKFMHITGPPGSGKSTLAGSITDRLQRPVNKKLYDTAYVSISASVPSQATSLALVKTVLSQLLKLRVGNVAMYYSLAWAYSECINAANGQAHEDLLWRALADILKQPIERGNDLIIVVDGIDELKGAETASHALEKLQEIITQGVRARLIVLSTSAVSTSAHGIRYEITHGDIHDDINAVILRALLHNHHFHGKPPPEQETVLDLLVHAAKGSFLWATVACEILNLSKSSEGFNKILEILKSSSGDIQALVLKLFTSLPLTNDAKILLSWLLTTERPLTIEEIHSLFSIDVQQATISHTTVDVHSTIHSLRSFITTQEHIVRFKHPLVQFTLRDLAHQAKVQIPVKDSHTRILLRILAYVKATLCEKREPVVGGLEPHHADRLFHQHHFLEYVVRYWVDHFRQTPFYSPDLAGFKPSPELQHVFPDTTTFTLLEQICWEFQLPTLDAVDRHVLVARIRKGVFTENHPTVLQTYLTCANAYTTLSRPSDAQAYFFASTKISRTILSDVHPVTVECAVRFLKITDTLTSTTRTEVMNHREELLIVLITAYERQYGRSSDLVIQTREALAQLYISIKEEERAQEIYRIIREITIEHYGKHSREAKDLHGRLNVVLGKGKDNRELETYKDSFFTDEDDEEKIIDVFDTNQVIIWLRRAQEYFARGEIILAEKTYVELWQQISHRCRTVQSVEWHEKHLDATTAYSQFLISHKRTSESSSVLISVWQQYEKHQLAYSESIVTRLTSVAKTIKSLGHHAIALSIFKFASSYYKSVRKEESSHSTEITREISSISTELIQQSLSSSTTSTQTTGTASSSVFQSIFQSAISSKTVDVSTIALAKKLSIQYVEQHNWHAAVTAIKSTLDITWHSFFSGSVHEVTLTTTFLKESVELIETLAEVFRQQRRIDKVEDVYMRFFRAVLSSPTTDKSIFEKAKTLLVTFYDKRGYLDNTISVFQDVLVVYRNVFGAAHELTIKTLYILGSRCKAHPRNHPYWIDYYQQIVTSLNKDSQHCHHDAMDAVIIVATSYWEDRRYAEAVTVFGVLWKTFVLKNKEYKQFTDSSFVQILYERYFQCLEETGVSWSILHKTTKEYRETTLAIFGAESLIVAEATLSLARVTQRSEEHASEAISWYEQASTYKSISTSVTEIKQQLSSLYVRQIKSTSSIVKSETFERAVTIHEERFSEVTKKYGYAHESSLTELRELVQLYSRQKKTDVAVRQLTTVVASIVTHESSSQKLIESASYIAASFQAIQQEQYCTHLIHQLHVQICAHDARHVSKWSFDLTKTGRRALVFLASLEYNLRQDLAITFSETLADITAEFIYFEQFRQALAEGSVRNLLVVAAPLRTFLLRNHLSESAVFVENEVLRVFRKRDAADLHTLSKNSPRLFIVSILEYLGSRKSTNFNKAVILASNEHVASLTKSKKFAEAYDIANLAFLFASNHDGYNGIHSISHGFKLASLLVGREGSQSPDANVRKKTLELSNRIVKEILEVTKRLKINLAQVQVAELSQLIALLGEQKDYGTLERLLTTLWNTRDAQRSWPADVLVRLGRRLVCARYLAGHTVKAIRLCEDIAYNMRRAHGPRAPVTIETYELLAQLYTSAGLTYQSQAATAKTGALATEHFKKALAVHEDILRLLVQDDDADDDSDDDDTAAALLAEHHGSVNGSVDGRFASSSLLDQSTASISDKPALALHHLHLLKVAFQRVGGWPKPRAEYERLNASLFREFGGEEAWKGARGVETWSAKGFGAGKAESEEGVFGEVRAWWIVDEEKGVRVAGDGNGHVAEKGALSVEKKVEDEDDGEL